MHLSRVYKDTGLLDWLNATLKNGFDKTADGRVTFRGCVCFEPSFARNLPPSLESRARSQIRFSVRNSLGLDSRWFVREYSQPLALSVIRICSTPMGPCFTVLRLFVAVGRWHPKVAASQPEPIVVRRFDCGRP